MAAIATLEEFASVLQSDVDTATGQLLLLDLAQGLVAEVIGERDVWPATAKAVALTAAARAYVNPTGARSTTKVAGPFTETVSYGADQVGVYLTDSEIARLKLLLTRGRSFAGTIRLRSGYPRIC